MIEFFYHFMFLRIAKYSFVYLMPTGMANALSYEEFAPLITLLSHQKK
ncbi:MAG: hypothetical protein ABI372_03505 [Ginsengibacter sp.]